MVQADEELIERAKREAEERGVSLAQFVREALEHELNGAPRRELSFVGKYRSDPAGPSARELTERYPRLPPRGWPLS